VAAHYIRDICQLDDDLLIILDLKSILHLDQGKDV
jgi:chemotaxis signal transduction protein